MSDLAGDTFFLDDFAFRQFDGGHAAQINIPKAEFVKRVHQLYAEVSIALATNCKATFLSLLPSTAYRHSPFGRVELWLTAMHPSASTALCPIARMQQ